MKQKSQRGKRRKQRQWLRWLKQARGGCGPGWGRRTNLVDGDGPSGNEWDLNARDRQFAIIELAGQNMRPYCDLLSVGEQDKRKEEVLAAPLCYAGGALLRVPAIHVLLVHPPVPGTEFLVSEEDSPASIAEATAHIQVSCEHHLHPRLGLQDGVNISLVKLPQKLFGLVVVGIVTALVGPHSTLQCVKKFLVLTVHAVSVRVQDGGKNPW